MGELSEKTNVVLFQANVLNYFPRFGLDDESWLSLASCFGKDYHGTVGSLDALAAYASNTGKR